MPINKYKIASILGTNKHTIDKGNIILLTNGMKNKFKTNDKTLT